MLDARSRSLRKYGLTLLDYDEMVKTQDGRCRICGTTESGIAGEVWAVDHDHVTKRVRALLCSACNAGLGLFGDKPERLRAAADYLETVEQRLRWQELAPAEKAEYLLAHSTISDRSWTDEPRRPGEKREAFIRRVLLGDKPERLRAAADYLETVEQRLRWQELAPAEKAEYLLAHSTISDRSWTDEPRRPGEKREAFIRRVLLGDVTQRAQ